MSAELIFSCRGVHMIKMKKMIDDIMCAGVSVLKHNDEG